MYQWLMFETQFVLPKEGHHQRQKHCHTIQLYYHMFQEVSKSEMLRAWTDLFPSFQARSACCFSSHHSQRSSWDGAPGTDTYKHILRHVPFSNHNYSCERSRITMPTKPWIYYLAGTAFSPSKQAKSQNKSTSPCWPRISSTVARSRPERKWSVNLLFVVLSCLPVFSLEIEKSVAMCPFNFGLDNIGQTNIISA